MLLENLLGLASAAESDAEAYEEAAFLVAELTAMSLGRGYTNKNSGVAFGAWTASR